MSDISKLHLTNGKHIPKSKTSLETEISFPFKFVNKDELASALKKVRRANQRKRDQEKWQQFIKLREEKNNQPNNLPPEVVISASCVESERPELESRGSGSHEETLFIGDEGAEETNYQESVENVSHIYQLGAGLTKRLQDLLSTVCRLTSVLVNPAQEQFEDEDVDRTIKRSQEFDAMFARNHLYEIQRLLKGTKKLTVAKALNTLELETKVSAALKCVTQALQVYTKHVGKGSRVKYQQVLPIFQSIATIESLLERLSGQRSFPLRKEIDVACSYMKQVLLEMSATETQTVSVVSHKPSRAHHKHKPSSDLSMYNRRRRRTAALARVRFGAPTKKSRRQTANGPGKSESVIEYQEDVTNNTVPTKEIPHRNATRAIKEDNVATMMEMIPPEPEDEDISLDADTFAALKQLNSRTSFSKCYKRNMDSQGNAASDVVKSMSTSSPQPPASAHHKLNSPRVEQHCKNKDSRGLPGQSLAREPKNVQLVCLKENEHKSKFILENKEEDVGPVEKEKLVTLTLEEGERSEIMEYHKQVMEYQNTCPHYKDGKAVGIVDRLANRILTEMVMDFQRNEMDQIIQMLYNLEFQ